jgi:outer membrane protein assembly factor BamB
MQRLLPKRLIACLTILVASLIVTASLHAADWVGFRGPGGTGVAEAKNLPTTWDSTKNIVWKRELPGLGTAMPIVIDSRIYLTAYSGYGESIDDPGEMDDLQRHVICLDRKTGAIQWEKSFEAVMPESTYRPGNDSKHGYASSTPTADDKHLFVFFGISGVYCLDLEDGSTVWNTKVGDGTHGWGSATSPVLYKDLVIVNASIESESLVALNKTDGKEVWRADGIRRCWSSPLLVDGDGRQEVVLNIPGKVAGFDPQTGKELWHCEGIDDYICPTVIANDGIVYALGGRRNTAIAVRAGGKGDVTDSHVIWRTNKGANVTSPVYLDGHLYWVHDTRGIAYCLNAETGEVVCDDRLEERPGVVYASITAADGKLFVPSRENGTFVLEAKPEPRLLSVNTFEDDESRTNASIVVHDNQLLLRTDKALYCIGQ